MFLGLPATILISCKNSTKQLCGLLKRLKMRLGVNIRRVLFCRHFFFGILMSCFFILQRLWFKTNLKLCKIWFDMGEYGRMNKVSWTICIPLRNSNNWNLRLYFPVWIWQILKELHKSCQKEDGTDDQKKGTQLLEVYAIEIQMYTETKNNKKLKVVAHTAGLRWYCLLSYLYNLFI